MKNHRKLYRNYFHILFLCFVCLAVYTLNDPSIDVMQRETKTGKTDGQITVILDPGHGGFDPGKVGINGALEKDINLSVALKLKRLLEQNDIKVIMTRDSDSGLYRDSDNNKKAADMRKRVDIINNSSAVLAVSIHQNSYTSEAIKGSQVFYYTRSKESEEFAKIMQDQLKDTLQDGNKREAKSNDSYYMLRKTECPIVIVECGYLSNSKEAALLLKEDYQERLAWAIHLGIFRYLNTLDR
ncbi:N-acetylmuramoyl-L-alanine amidase [Anaerocolumna xylanovorans]|uniref:N-acetylmuramoyl-L-alanine amidase n=1 Tax=Anaerocolumna xylanovorans DSM 12503 TaxID=1121345 RepID=A0A1M7YA00_9FIRM|nr:N-acetylmuramoyl-L-alanine amidase [Anaerocolumna xylanovorans]SHO49396.1 N-acetylmuramoyl-L-alanine amidase [Anaerocolumna xylanovorans DSM 12503]